MMNAAIATVVLMSANGAQVRVCEDGHVTDRRGKLYGRVDAGRVYEFAAHVGSLMSGDLAVAIVAFNATTEEAR